MISRQIELRKRALAILGLENMFTQNELLSNFRRQIKLVNPNGPESENPVFDGYTNSDIARLLIQCYNLIVKRDSPTTMLEDDTLVGILIGKEGKQISEIREMMEKKYGKEVEIDIKESALFTGLYS